MAVNFNLVYPPVGNNNNNLQYIKAVIPTGYATVVTVFTTAANQGRFFCTDIVLHDPTATYGVSSVAVSFGSASSTNATTAISPVLYLTGLTGSVQNQFLRYQPGITGVLLSTALVATVATTTQNPGNLYPSQALSEGDIVQAFVQTAGVATTSGAVLVDLIGYYL